MVDVPGTVSQILWHFTGGPRWNEDQKEQNVAPKPAAEAYAALLGILKTKELRLGGYKEVVRVHLDKVRTWSKKKKKYEVKHNVTRILESCPVSCLADIPIMHLSYHAGRYGKFAIGFHRDATVRVGFNPVFYTLQNSNVIRTIRQGFARIRSLDLTLVDSFLDDLESEVESLPNAGDIDVDGPISTIRALADDAVSRADSAKESIAHFLAFVKTFNSDQFHSVYCEREWRSVASFPFDYDDVAMIVLPKAVGDTSFFQPFVKKSRNLGIPASIPIVPWETLLES